jgi:Tfp pilus assembly protein PilN
MKITLNLATPPTFRERYGLALGVPVLVFAILLGGLLGHYARKNYREKVELARSLEKLQARRAELGDETRKLQSALKQPGAQGTLHEVEFVNTLIGRKRLSLSDLTTKIAVLLPPDVRLANLIMLRSGNQSELRFQVTGRSEAALETFMENLQDSADFADPIITASGSEQQGAGTEETTLVCQTRYIALDRTGLPNKSRRE